MAKQFVWVSTVGAFLATAYACSSPEGSPPRGVLEPDALGGKPAVNAARPVIKPIMNSTASGGTGGSVMASVPPASGGMPPDYSGSTKDVSGYNTGDQGCNPDDGCAGSMIVGAPGTVLREVWNDIPHVGFQGNTSSIAALTSRMYSPDFPDHPNFSDQLMTGLLAHAPGNPLQPTDWAENYGQRIRGFIKAPETGVYVFWLDSDNSAQLWLSLSTPDKARPIAVVDDYSPANSFLLPGQKSGPIPLTEGKYYYIDIFHKEGGGNDFCEVRWAKPSDPQGKPGHTYFVVPPSVLYSAVPGVDMGTGGTGGVAATGGAPSAGGNSAGGAGGSSGSATGGAGGTNGQAGANGGGMSGQAGMSGNGGVGG